MMTAKDEEREDEYSQREDEDRFRELGGTPCDMCPATIFGTSEECKICHYYNSAQYKEDFPE